MEDASPARLEGTLFESGDGSPPAEPAPLERGVTLSRYLLVERVGIGGMGVVWAAYDPELDRKVAIKLLRPRMDRGGTELARSRLVREAQALARLKHPNVIAVYGVGEHDGQVYLAMEFVQGKTLGRWVRATRRTWREIVAVYVQAGHGLAEAHRAQIVHRDFKPANVLIDADGRARVLDFGLARSVEGSRAELEDEVIGTASWSGLRSQRVDPNPIVTPLTRTGSLLGTPAYMAPEQFEGRQFDARADQFAFCVALWEALYGRRPFSGDTIEDLRKAVVIGKVEIPNNESRVPSFIERALRRGLAVDPAERWDSMDALLDELMRDPASGRRRWLIAGSILASFAAALIVAPMLDEEPRELAAPGCAEAGGEELWTRIQRDELARLVFEAGPMTTERWTGIATALDVYAGDCSAMRVEICEAVDGGVLTDPGPRERCLAERERAFASVVAQLGAGDPELLAGAPALLAALPPVDACARPRYVANPASSAELERLRPRLLAAQARAEVGAIERATAELDALATEAEALPDPSLRIALLIASAAVDRHAAAPDRARARLEQAVAEAIRNHQDVFAAEAATLLIDVVGRDLGDPRAGLRWAARAEAWHDRVDAPAIARARRLVAEADLHASLGELELAAQRHIAALELLGVSRIDYARARVDVAVGRVAARAFESLARIARAHADLEDERGLWMAVHELRELTSATARRDAARAALEVAVINVELGEWDVAAGWFAVAIPHDRSDPDAGLALLEHARLLLDRAELLPAGLDRAEQAIIAASDAIQLVDAEGPLARQAKLELARLDRLRGRHDEAAQKLADLTGVAGLEAAVALERGELLLARADPKGALAAFDQALAAFDQAPGGLDSRASSFAEAVSGRGRALVLLGRVDEARVELDRALAIWRRIEPFGHPRSIPASDALTSVLERRSLGDN